jgi:hypothetical protein
MTGKAVNKQISVVVCIEVFLICVSVTHRSRSGCFLARLCLGALHGLCKAVQKGRKKNGAAHVKICSESMIARSLTEIRNILSCFHLSIMAARVKKKHSFLAHFHYFL